MPAPAAAIASLSPTHGQTATSVVIAGTNLGTSGTVRFGATVATTTAWSATQVTATVPASLAPGTTTVTVTPAGATAAERPGLHGRRTACASACAGARD